MKENRRIEWADVEPYCVCRYVLQRFWMVILSALLCIMSVFLIQNLSATPSYTSSVTFAVTSRSTIGSSLGNIAVTGTVASRFGSLLSSSVVRDAAASRMALTEFPADVTITAPENTNIIVMDVTSSSPELAYKSTLAIMESHKPYSAAIFDTAVLESISGPSIAPAPDSSGSRSMLLILSGPAGALLMICALVLLCIQADTVHTSSGARHQVDAKLLATIHHERKHRTLRSFFSRKKNALLISDPMCSFYYTETIHQLRIIFERAYEKEDKQIFVISSCSENEGKSTVAANLALSLAQKHEKVLLVDADLRKPAQALIFDDAPQSGKHFGTLVSRGFSRNLLNDAISYNESTNLYTLYSSAVSRKKMEALSAESFRPIFDALREDFSYIIVDTPPLGIFADAEVLSDVADASIMIVRQDLLPSVAINDTIDALSSARATFMGFVLNNVHAMHIPFFSVKGSGYGFGYGYGYGYNYGYGYSYGRSNKKSSSSGKGGM